MRPQALFTHVRRRCSTIMPLLKSSRLLQLVCFRGTRAPKASIRQAIGIRPKSSSRRRLIFLASPTPLKSARTRTTMMHCWFEGAALHHHSDDPWWRDSLHPLLRSPLSTRYQSPSLGMPLPAARCLASRLRHPPPLAYQPKLNR